MNNFELVEKLVNTFGVSYEEAKNALEQCGWDPVEAAVILEKAKNGTPEAEEPKEEPRVKGNAEKVRNDWRDEGNKFFKTIWNFLSLNNFVMKKATGEVFLDIPLWLSILLLCTFFWPIVIIMVIVFIMGYRFSFSGPNLGKKSVQDAVDRMETAGQDFVDRVKNSVAEDSCQPPVDGGQTSDASEQPADVSGDSDQQAGDSCQQPAASSQESGDNSQ